MPVSDLLRTEIRALYTFILTALLNDFTFSLTELYSLFSLLDARGATQNYSLVSAAKRL